jgi:hypothetical protein
MMVHEVLSRRSFLGYAAITLAAGPVSAVDEPSQYSISALIEGDGMVRIPAGEFLMGSALEMPMKIRSTGCASASTSKWASSK